jgi:glycolate oxidase FAD binding subunit
VRLPDHQLVSLFTDRFGVDSAIAFDSLNSQLQGRDFQGQDFQGRIADSLNPDSLSPACVVYPQTIAELSAAIPLAYQHRLRVLLCGNATKLDWGGLVSRADVVISTSRLNQVIEHCVGDLTVTVEAGVKYQDLQAVLAKQGQFLAIDPPYIAGATIGGILATGSAGSLRHRYNSVRDMCLGIEFVRSDGEIVKAGGRVVKNVAGYDLMKLLTGSFGTLGVVSSVTFRLYPLPEYTQVVVITGSAEAIAQAQEKISTSVLTPTACDLLSASVISDLAISPLNAGENVGLAMQFSSLKASVIEQCDRVTKLAEELNLQVQVITEYQEFWQLLELVMWKEDLRNRIESAPTNHVLCKLGVLPSAAVSMMEQCEQIFSNLSHYLQFHLGSGLGLLRVEYKAEKEVAAIAEQIAKVRLVAESHGGFLTILEAPHALKFKQNVWGYRGNAGDLMHKLQMEFDPRGLLSPDRLF